MRALASAGRLVVCGVLGAWTAVCALGLAPWTWGLVLGLAAGTATAVALHRGSARLGFCLGWAGVVAVVLPARPAGDVVVADNAHGWALLGSALVALIVGVATLPAPARRRGRPASTS